MLISILHLRLTYASDEFEFKFLSTRLELYIILQAKYKRFVKYEAWVWTSRYNSGFYLYQFIKRSESFHLLACFVPSERMVRNSGRRALKKNGTQPPSLVSKSFLCNFNRDYYIPSSFSLLLHLWIQPKGQNESLWNARPGTSPIWVFVKPRASILKVITSMYLKLLRWQNSTNYFRTTTTTTTVKAILKLS